MPPAAAANDPAGLEPAEQVVEPGPERRGAADAEREGAVDDGQRSRPRADVETAPPPRPASRWPLDHVIPPSSW